MRKLVIWISLLGLSFSAWADMESKAEGMAMVGTETVKMTQAYAVTETGPDKQTVARMFLTPYPVPEDQLSPSKRAKWFREHGGHVLMVGLSEAELVEGDTYTVRVTEIGQDGEPSSSCSGTTITFSEHSTERVAGTLEGGVSTLSFAATVRDLKADAKTPPAK